MEDALGRCLLGRTSVVGLKESDQLENPDQTIKPINSGLDFSLSESHPNPNPNHSGEPNQLD